MDVLRPMQADIHAMRLALSSGNKAAKNQRAAVNSKRGPPPANRRMPEWDAQGRFVKPVAVPRRKTPERDGKGRFIGSERPKNFNPNKKTKDDAPGEESEDSGSGGGGGGNGSYTKRVAGAVADAVRSSIGNALQGTENVDPTIAAAKEVADTVGPLAKPITAAFGAVNDERKDRKRRREGAKETAKENLKLTIPWYKRLLGAMKGGGGIAGTAGLEGAAAGGIGGIVASIAPKALSLIKGLSAAALPLAGMASAYKSFETTTEDYAKKMGVELTGSLPQELGVRFVGALGDLGDTLTGGLATKFGEVVAGPLSDVFTKISTSWDGLISGGQAMFDKASMWIGDKIDAGKKALGSARDAVIDKASDVKASVVDTAQNIAHTATFGAYKGGSNAMKESLETQATAAGITDPRERATFMAQMDHESGGFKNSTENLNYSATRLAQVNPKRFANPDGSPNGTASAVAGDPQKTAEAMYGGRMGNTSPGDAYNFRGRGATQLTGKSNYEAAGKALGLDLVNNPDLAADPTNGAKIATWYWQKNNLGAAARAGDTAAVTKGINGGTVGSAQRDALTSKYLAASPGGMTPSGATATSATVPIPPMTAVPPEPLNSKKGNGNTNVTLEAPITQNVGDRAIAQVATGGMGGKNS